MAINKNHEFEELNGIKCAIVEKNITSERCQFLQTLLTQNHYEVVVVETPATETLPASYTVGVSDLTFNPINAIFGRILKTADGHIVTLAYWQQKEAISDDSIPYFNHV